MKYVVVLCDGMADRPLKELGGKTPLEAANKSNMDYVARNGRCGLLRTLREGMPLGSDIANLSLLGYDPKKYYPGGRGPLEAAAMGVKLKEGDIAFRCNLITERGGILEDYSGGHITSEEARGLIRAVDKELGGPKMSFFPGVSYRHLMVLNNPGIYPADLNATPPHDIVGQKIEDNLIRPARPKARAIADELNDAMKRSEKILAAHEVNKKRIAEGIPPANMIWLWGGGIKPKMPSFREKYGLSGALISAVDLLRGMASYIGLEVIEVPGATGYFDTDYRAKAKYALNALKKNDLVYVHVEAPDEAGHEGKTGEKIRAIEQIDEKIVGPILEEYRDRDLTLAVLPDHATPIEARTHTIEPVPFAIYCSKTKGDKTDSYGEKEAAKGSYGLREGTEFMDLLLECASKSVKHKIRK